MNASHAVIDTLTGRPVHVGTADQARNTADLSNGYVGSDDRFMARALSTPTCEAAPPAVGVFNGRTVHREANGEVTSGRATARPSPASPTHSN